MRKYRVIQDNRRYGELEVEWDNGVKLILTECRRIYADDYSGIRSWVVDCLDETQNQIPEYMYEFSFMPDGYSLISFITGSEVAEKALRDNVTNIMKRNTVKIKEYLSELSIQLTVQ